MGLKTLGKIKKAERFEFEADLSAFGDGEEIKIKFRRPLVQDYFPDESVRKQLMISFPEVASAGAMLSGYALVLGACYVADAEDAGMEPWRAIAQIGRDNPEAFMSLVEQFQAKFPGAIDEAKADAKNDLTQ